MSLRTILLSMFLATTAYAEQFVLFDQEFTFELKDAVPTESHLKITPDKFSKDTPKDWTQPCDSTRNDARRSVSGLAVASHKCTPIWPSRSCWITMN